MGYIETKIKLKFPKGFLWGAATAAHQIEGNNKNSDWWAWEHSLKRELELKKHGKNPADYFSGLACDSYNRYNEDFDLAESLNHNATRLSIEWARIEPKEGVFDQKELDHYEKVLQSAKSRGLTTFVTLHHFTSPKWFMDKGGFVKKENISYFVNFALKTTERLQEYADFWLTFNEPQTYCSESYLAGDWPPQKRNLISAYKVAKNLIQAHNLCAPKIRLQTRKPVSTAYNLTDWQPADKIFGSFLAFVYYKINKYIFNRTIDESDFIAVNYYFHHHVGFFGHRPKSESKHQVSDIGWGIHPEGLEQVLLRLKKWNKPVYVTENGIADAKDLQREKFIKDHLYYVHKAVQKGVDVKGYLYWSLLDNFEWAQGFSPRFGLVEIDYEDLLRRKVRKSAWAYAEICKNNSMEY